MINLCSEIFGDIIIIHIEGSYNIDSLSKVERVWMEQVDMKPSIIAINCKKMEGLDSSAIGSIVKFFNYAMSHNIMIIFYDLNPLLKKLFVTAKLDRYFTIITKKEFEKTCAINTLEAPLPQQFYRMQ